ncbi:MAG: choice-of-anchor X domain-containing protein [Bacteroidota bacterium]
MNIGPFQLPEDILTIILTASVKVGASPSTVGYTLFQDRRLQPLTEGELNNLGVSPDIFASDSIFTGAVTFQINRSFIGNLTLELVPQSSDGIIGTSFLQTIEIQRFNHPPVLSNLQAPDTVRISLQSFVISVQASDPDGAPDIASVTRQTPSGLILNLNDSGTNGDAVAGDGIYTEVVDLDSSTPLGSYSFVFRALDQSNATSNTILHTIIVLQ